MKNEMKKFIAMIVCGVILAAQFALPACAQPQKLVRLPSPKNFTLQDNVITWDEVADAVGYVVSFESRETETAKASYTLPDGLAVGEYTLEVLALGDYESYDDSKWTTFPFTFPSDNGKDEPSGDVHRDQDYDSIGMLYTLLPDGSGYEVSQGRAGKKLAGTVTIPETFKGLPVKRIADNAFTCYSNYNLDPFRDIGCNVAIKGFVLPSTLEEIGEEAFAYMTRIEEFVLPQSVKVIGTNAFRGCLRLKHINLPYGIKEIPAGCFSECNLEEIEIPDSVEIIGLEAFAGGWARETDSDLKPDLDQLEITKSMQYLTKVVIPDSVKVIRNSAFGLCTNLKEITMSQNLIFLGQYVFGGTEWLRSHPDGPVTLGNVLYGYLGTPVSVTIPQNVTKIADSPFNIDRGLLDVPFESRAMDTLEEVTIHDGVEFIGDSIFSGCEKLTSVRLPQDLVSIPEMCFNYCPALGEIELPDSLKQIGLYAFRNCTSLKEIYLPDGLEEIEGWIFEDCTSLTEIHLPDTIEQICSGMFNGCKSLAHIELPESVTTIGGSAFKGCESLAHIELPEGVTTLGGNAFRECSALKEIVLHAALNELGSCPFQSCDSLEAIYFEGTEPVWTTLMSQHNVFVDYPGALKYPIPFEDAFSNATIYFLQEDPPQTAGNYWHYLNGKPTVWET